MRDDSDNEEEGEDEDRMVEDDLSCQEVTNQIRQRNDTSHNSRQHKSQLFQVQQKSQPFSAKSQSAKVEKATSYIKQCTIQKAYEYELKRITQSKFDQ